MAVFEKAQELLLILEKTHQKYHLNQLWWFGRRSLDLFQVISEIEDAFDIQISRKWLKTVSCLRWRAQNKQNISRRSRRNLLPSCLVIVWLSNYGEIELSHVSKKVGGTMKRVLQNYWRLTILFSTDTPGLMVIYRLSQGWGLGIIGGETPKEVVKANIDYWLINLWGQHHALYLLCGRYRISLLKKVLKLSQQEQEIQASRNVSWSW